MRHLILSGFVLVTMSSSSFAADLVSTPTSAAYSPVPIAHNWTGFYVGAFGGLGGSMNHFTQAGVAPLDLNGGGALIGAQTGYDFEYSNVVFGLYGDLSVASIEAKEDFDDRLSSTVDGIASAQGKIGLPVLDNVLLYLHGGYVYADENHGISWHGSEGHNGFVVGVGAEYALDANLSVNTEYGYYQLADTYVQDLGGGRQANEQTTFNALKVGVNYRF